MGVVMPPTVTAVKAKGIPCTYQPLKEGYRAWAAGFGLPRTVTGKKADLAYEFSAIVSASTGASR